MAPCTRLSQRDCTQGPAAAARQAPAAQPRASAAPRSRLAANGGSAALGPGGAAAARGSRRLYAAAVPQPAQEAAPEPAPPATPQQGGVEGMVWNAEMQAEWEAYQARTERGGYYPVLEGEQFKEGRYTVLHFLGQGHYSTVWRVLDATTGQHCAMKVVKSAEAYAEAARDEVALLAAVAAGDPSDAKHCVRLLDQFEHAGPHGSHVCEVFGVMGDDLLALIRAYRHRGIPLPVVRHLTRQMLLALDYLHTECQIIHTDVKPENVMLTDTVLPSGERHLSNHPPEHLDLEELGQRLLRAGCKLVDFGNACWAHTHFSETIQTRQYRAPEVILGAGYDGSADIWSLGCLVYELATGQYLFNPRTVGTRGRDRDHLAQMMQRLGHMPRRVAVRGRHAADFFAADGRLWHMSAPPAYWPLDRVLMEQHGMAEEEAIGLGDFLREIMHFDPARRATAAELLEHSWLRGELPRRPPGPASQLAFWGAREGGGAGREQGGGGQAGEAGSAGRGGSPRRSPSPPPHPLQNPHK